MSEYLHVEKPFLNQLSALGWNAIDQGVGVIPSDPSLSLRSTFREWLLPELRAEELRLTRLQVESAEAVFLCNAVRGILPVARLGDRAWAPHPQVSALRARLAAAAPQFADPYRGSPA